MRISTSRHDVFNVTSGGPGPRPGRDEHDEHDEEESEKEPSPQTSSVPKIYPGSQIDANRNFLFFNTFLVPR